jgi:hypothetical protein
VKLTYKQTETEDIMNDKIMVGTWNFKRHMLNELDNLIKIGLYAHSQW